MRVQRHLKENGKLSPEDIAKLVEAEELQKQIHERLGDRPDVGLRAELQRIQDTIQENPQTRSGCSTIAWRMWRRNWSALRVKSYRRSRTVSKTPASRPNAPTTEKPRRIAPCSEEEAKEHERLAG